MQSNAVHVEPTSSCTHPKTIEPSPCTVTDGDALVRVNPSSTDSLNKVTVNDMGRIKCIFRLTILFATNRTQFQQFFTDNESTIQLLIQRLYSLPVPYSTECSVTMDRYTASWLHLAMLEALTPVRTTENSDCLWNGISICLCGSESYMYSLRLLTAYDLINFKERMVAQLCVQNLGDTAGAERRWSDLIRIAITLTAWGTDFHVYVISVVLNTPIFMLTSFVHECNRMPSYYIDPSLDLTQLSITNDKFQSPTVCGIVNINACI